MPLGFQPQGLGASSAVMNIDHWTGFQAESLDGRKPTEVGAHHACPARKQIVSPPQNFLELCALNKEPACCLSPPSAFREISFHSGILQTSDSITSGTSLDP